MESKIKNKKSHKKQNGITIVALTVTIVILLILAGITITMLSGEDGVIEKAQESADATKKAEFITSVQLDILAKQLEKDEITASDIEDVLNRYYKDGTIEKIIKDDAGNITGVKLKDLTEEIPIADIIF